MLKGKKFINKRSQLFIILTATSIPVMIVLMVAFFLFTYYGKIHPGVYINSYRVSGYTKAQAEEFIIAVQLPDSLEVSVETGSGTQSFNIPLTAFKAELDTKTTAEQAYLVGRKGHLPSDIVTIYTTARKSIRLPLVYKYDSQALEEFLAGIAGQVEVAPVEPTIEIAGNTAIVEQGKTGEELDVKELKETILNRLSNARFDTITTRTKLADPSLSTEESLEIKTRAEKLIGKRIAAGFEFEVYYYDHNTLVSFLIPTQSNREDNIGVLAADLASKIERLPQNPTFIFEEGRVQEFTPAKNGVQLDRDLFINEFTLALERLGSSDEKEISLKIPIVETQPDFSTAEVNNMGISELVGRGTSRFRGSIASRVHNIALAASKLNGYLIKPGEAFSFNDALGDISVFTGYKQAYVIQNGRTVLGDGGGVCQVSTTFFRAALNAGLPIVERRAHSYRVGYYEQDSGPGLDATIYAPTTDLKVLNDTPAHLLIQTKTDTENLTLTIEIYGTSDGRVATVSKPVITSSTAPPEDLYVDDPSLPEGVVQQIEHKAWGAKTQFDYHVQRGGEVLIDTTFYSNYRPWQAVFNRGTGPVL